MKKILMLIIAACALTACNTPQLTPEQSAISRVVAANASYAANSTSIAQLVVSEQTNSLAGCPKNFVDAYNDNIAAWQSFAAIEKKMYALDRTKAQSDIKTFLSEYLGDSMQAIIKLKSQWPQFDKEIDKAFSDVTRTLTSIKVISANNGVAYPKPSTFSGMF